MLSFFVAASLLTTIVIQLPSYSHHTSLPSIPYLAIWWVFRPPPCYQLSCWPSIFPCPSPKVCCSYSIASHFLFGLENISSVLDFRRSVYGSTETGFAWWGWCDDICYAEVVLCVMWWISGFWIGWPAWFRRQGSTTKSMIVKWLDSTASQFQEQVWCFRAPERMWRVCGRLRRYERRGFRDFRTAKRV